MTIKRLAFPIAVCVCAACAAFLIPFLLPPTTPSYSQSYVVGYNNRLASALLIATSLAACAWTWLSSRDRRVSRSHAVSSALSSWHILWPAIPLTCWIAIASKLILKHTSRSVEDFTFIPQMQKVFFFHRHLYSQVEFAYGPLMFYPTLWLARLLGFYTGPVNLAYYITLLVHHLLGLCLLLYLVNALPQSRGMKLGLFLAISLYSFTPVMGLNYTLLRFLLPLGAIVFLSRLRSQTLAPVAAFLAVLCVAGFSAELGTALCLGIVALCIVRFRSEGMQALWMLVGAAAGALVFVLAVPSEYFSALRHFSTGYNNLVLVPSFDVLFLLLCTVWLAPMAIVPHVRQHTQWRDLLVGMYGVSLGMLPPALGASEIMHVLGNGVGFLLLGSVAIYGRRLTMITYCTAIAIVELLMVAQFAMKSRQRFLAAVTCGDPGRHLSSMAHRAPRQIRNFVTESENLPCPNYVSLAWLENYTHGEPFVIPWVTDANVSERLALAPNYRPSYFHGTINVWGPDAQRIKINEMRQVRWAVVYSGGGVSQVPGNMAFPLSPRTHFRSNHTVYSDDLMFEELKRNWVPVASPDGKIELYRRVQ